MKPLLIAASLSLFLPLASCAPKKKTAKPADVSTSTLDPILGQILPALEKQPSCTVKIADEDSDIELKRWKNPPAADSLPIDPFNLLVTSKIEIGPPTNRRTCSTSELNQQLEMYHAAAAGADEQARVIIHVRKDTDDILFRSVLRTLARNPSFEIFILNNQKT